MPRWKALPDELDPQVREFADQLRRLVDRSGLSLAGIADRTGYSKTSWERCLDGRLLAPRPAILALAEATGTSPVHLLTLWELAERAWNRSGAAGTTANRSTPDATARDPYPHPRPRREPPLDGARIAEARAALTTPAGTRAGTAVGAPGRTPPARKATMFLAGLVGALLVVAAAVLLTDLGEDPGKGAVGAPGTGRSPSATSGGPGGPATSPVPTPATGAPSALPAGVKCAGADCAGQDPQAMGCGGPYARTVVSATVGTAVVEVRHSEVCGAAWARISRALPGDTVSVTAGGTTRSGVVRADMDAYTPMVAVADGTRARACATLHTGKAGCAGAS
ncbi:helix-turn-helix domain-containing protein [Streptomyces sp. NPDC047928]|uniref:helix-turn-helix domain-containing protein n=1 Tax=unclassified Streptomyces TaxID=2593676 RepID=UPI003713C8FE